MTHKVLNDMLDFYFEKAEKLYGLKRELVTVDTSLRGLAAGWACKEKGKLIMRLNLEHAEKHWPLTVPHELAHLVNMAGLAPGHAHDANWKKVCIALGGDGKRLHNEEFTPTRERKEFTYLLPNGEKATLGPIQHKRCQEGRMYQTRKTKQIIRAEHWVK